MSLSRQLDISFSVPKEKKIRHINLLFLNPVFKLRKRSAILASLFSSFHNFKADGKKRVWDEHNLEKGISKSERFLRLCLLVSSTVLSNISFKCFVVLLLLLLLCTMMLISLSFFFQQEFHPNFKIQWLQGRKSQKTSYYSSCVQLNLFKPSWISYITVAPNFGCGFKNWTYISAV